MATSEGVGVGGLAGVGGRVREGKTLPRSGMDRVPETPAMGAAD